MKKVLLTVCLFFVACVLVFSQSIQTGVGNPVGRVQSEDSLYINTTTNVIWVALDEEKGAFKRLPSLAQLQFGYTTLDVALSETADEVDVDLNFAVNYVVSSGTADVVKIDDSLLPVQDLFVVYSDEADGADTLVVTPENLASWTSVELGDVDEMVHLKWVADSWHVVTTTGTPQ